MPTDTKLNQLIINQLTQEQYDEAKAAGTLSDTELYITDSDDDALTNNKVSKSGDTMTGNLIINKKIPEYILQASTLDLSQTFTDDINDSFILERDKNGKDGGFITFRHDKYDSNVTEVCASNGIAPNRKIQAIGIWVKKNGEYGTYAPKCSFDKSIVTTVSHGNNWIRLGNGLQFCWGNSPNNQTITLPQAFINNTYSVAFCQTENSSYTYNNVAVEKTTTSFKFINGYTGDWIAIGWWY